MKSKLKSLRLHIGISLFLVALLPLIVLYVVVLGTYEKKLIDARMIEVKQRCQSITAELGRNASVREALTESTSADMKWYSDVYEGRLVIVDDTMRIVMDTYQADTGKVCISDAVFQAFKGDTYQHYDSSRDYIEFAMPVYYTSADSEKTVTAVLILSSTTDWISESLSSVQQALIVMEILLIIFSAVMSVLIAELITGPIRKAAVTGNNARSGNAMPDPSELKTYTEIDGIVGTASDLVRRYQDVDKAQEEFVANVSHELRTPMASIRVLADSLIGQQNLSEEIYQEFLQDISFEIDRSSNIIDDLLELSRLGTVSDTMNVESTNLNDLLMELLKRLRPIAASAEVELIYETFRQVNADCDSLKLGRAVTNIIENGIKYNEAGGFVRVSLDADHEYAYIRVADNGIGIPEDAQEHLFDRFYRVDKARSRDTGGTGLGLSIARSIILAHHGLIKVESAVSKGTTFTIRLPLKYQTEKGDKA